MSKADKMLRDEGWEKVANPEELEPIFVDYYSKKDSVYEMYIEYSGGKKLTCRLYFIGKVYGFSYKDVSIELSIKEHLAIHEKLKELGWIE